MQFCSKYAYDYGFEGSDEEDVEDEHKVTTSSKIRKADTNIISVNFDELISTNLMFAGEPIQCRKCQAIMNKTSQNNLSKDRKIWTCEFCYENNTVDLDTLEQFPSEEDVTFLLEPAPQTSHEDVNNFTDDKYLIYCIDISGSMDTQVIHNTPNDNNKRMTRLDAVKIACVQNLNALKTQEPNKRVSLVSFSENVRYYGDATKTNNQLTIEEKNVLNNKEKIFTLAENQKGDLKSLRDSNISLTQRIKSLNTEGYTALGPALAFSVAFVSRLPGSQVILCTDGCANIGIGSVEQNLNAEKFYEDLANYAKGKGIVVNVITMEGTDCRLALLGKVADLTNGSVNVVNPLDLGKQFSAILENRCIATDVKAKLIVNNRYLYIRDDDLELAEAKAYESESIQAKTELNKLKKSIVERNIGNANIETAITFEFGIRKLSNEEKEQSSTNLDKLPFQLQISYTMPNGAKALRVITKTQEFTKERSRAEREIVSKESLFANYAQKMSNFVTTSNVKAAKYKIQQIQKLNQNAKLELPAVMAENIQLVSSMHNTMRSSELNDREINKILLFKKANEKFFSK
ncbi:unnamed protein product [Brachionus calyciflorus]|uniref:VWFA domain-containing protein n=1 Tax=Brachionus calyciflorus TaxID=104777 RepID=A0A813XPC2_9BILA|nr:unnamed protein product [Brachionus calyciflorus]